MRSESSNRHASRGIAVDRDESMRPAETSLSPDASPRSPSLSSFPTPYRRRSPLAAPALTPLTSYLNPTSRRDAPARFPYRRRHTAPAFAPPPNPSRSPAGPPSRTTQPGLARLLLRPPRLPRPPMPSVDARSSGWAALRFPVT
jgi:hypothetical protein